LSEVTKKYNTFVAEICGKIWMLATTEKNAKNTIPRHIPIVPVINV